MKDSNQDKQEPVNIETQCVRYSNHSNRRAVPGINDLESKRPDLAKEWNYSNNGSLKPSDIMPGSDIKVWWICSKGHEWKASAYSRSYGHGCPICGRKILLANAYKTRLKKNGSLEDVRPDLLSEWDYEKNTDIQPNQIAPKSNRKVWWKCENGHQWYATVVNRTNLGRGCPYCSNQIPVVGENDLQTLYPEISAQWHPTKNGKLTPRDVTAGSKRKIWWICDKGHEYASIVKSRVSSGHGCPYCSNKAVLSGFNDLETTHPDIAKEWDLSQNQGLLPSMVSYGSGKKVWWKCQFDHSYQATVYNRVNGEGCPICSGRLRTSFPEQAIFYYVKKEFPDAINRDKTILGNRMELDVYIPSIRTAIEYDGKAFHLRPENIKRDQKKYSLCKAQNISLIRIIETDELKKTNTACDYCVELIDGRIKHLEPAIRSLLIILGRTIDVDIDRDRNRILAYLEETQTSLLSEFPDIAKEWHPTRNGSLLPSMFFPGSNEKVWWKCPKCGREWRTSLSERTGHDKTGCPYCSKIEGAAKNIKTRIRKKGNLASSFPDLMKEWDYTKNEGINPEDLTCGSGVRVWWKCSICGNEWDATINHRTHGRGCPICKKGKIALKNAKPVDMISPDRKVVVKSFQSIAEAQRKTGIFNIQRGLKDCSLLVGGYYWQYSSDIHK